MSQAISDRARLTAAHLYEAHRRREPFRALPEAVRPRTIAEAYAAQDAFVALKQAERHATIAGHKIALTTPAMRAMIGYDDSIAGIITSDSVNVAPARVRAADYGRLLIECEIAFRLSADAPPRGSPYDRTGIASHVDAVMPAFEIADDRNADYTGIAAELLGLVADNAWNEGAVLGPPIAGWQSVDLAALHGVASINGRVVGEGYGRDVLGHPLDALAWIANHLLARGRMLKHGEIVITGSLVTSKFPNAGDSMEFVLHSPESKSLGQVCLQID